ncbi:MAG: Platelet-activating factor acetylhydrolase plasma/intracellular isoform II [candidate division TM6 bacterium GW2011_GWF2_37_49]|nr:MAG: Platelet-activating factor acetylhydrolase plasma/intracellular isoform II [candidate division TM6 bacterium GW2011_GWF2_37_49]
MLKLFKMYKFWGLSMNIFKQIKFLILVLILALLPGCSWSMDKTATKYYDFPKPTGKYAVGTRLLELTDPSRNDLETSKPRELVVQVWYPSEQPSIQSMTPYAYESLAEFKKDEEAETIEKLDSIRTHGIFDASPVAGKYPVVIFGHGFGMSRGSYSFFCENIASHGYVVVMVMHTFVTELTKFADGREFGLTRKRNFAVFDECFKDIEFMLDKVISGALGPLTAVCDFTNIGIIGHSLGGVMASHVCRGDARVKAGISLDGPLFGINGTKPFNKPFLFVLRSNFYEYFNRFSKDENEYSLDAAFEEPKTFVGSNERFCKANGQGAMQIVVRGAEHNTFSDLPILVGMFKEMFGQELNLSNLETGNVSADALSTIQGCIITFFNKNLKNQPDAYPSLVKHDEGAEDFTFYIH